MAERRAGRILLAAALALVLGYAAIAALVYTRQRSLIYYPGYTRVDAAATDFELQVDDVRLRGWQVNPGRTDALVYFGGNAERIEAWREPFAGWFHTRTVYLVAYRGYGASEGEPGRRPCWPTRWPCTTQSGDAIRTATSAWAAGWRPGWPRNGRSDGWP